MIGNKYLDVLFRYPDEDTSINQLLEMLKSTDAKFIAGLEEPVDLDLCCPQEKEFLTKVAALIDYYFQILGLEVPGWLRDERLSFEYPYYYSQRRLSDFEKFKLQYTNPAPFKARNVFFDLDGISRI